MECCGCARAHISVNIYVRDQKAKCSEQILFCILPVRKLNTVLFRNIKGCCRHKKAAADNGSERIIYRYNDVTGRRKSYSDIMFRFSSYTYYSIGFKIIISEHLVA